MLTNKYFVQIVLHLTDDFKAYLPLIKMGKKLFCCLTAVNNQYPCMVKVGTHDGTSPCDKSQGLVAGTSCQLTQCDLLQGLVAGTRPIVCANLTAL